MLGHKTASVTLDRYGHLYTEDLENVSDLMDQNTETQPDPDGTPHGPSIGRLKILDLFRPFTRPFDVGRPGLEPGTYGLRVRCSAS